MPSFISGQVDMAWVTKPHLLHDCPLGWLSPSLPLVWFLHIRTTHSAFIAQWLSLWFTGISAKPHNLEFTSPTSLLLGPSNFSSPFTGILLFLQQIFDVCVKIKYLRSIISCSGFFHQVPGVIYTVFSIPFSTYIPLSW